MCNLEYSSLRKEDRNEMKEISYIYNELSQRLAKAIEYPSIGFLSDIRNR